MIKLGKWFRHHYLRFLVRVRGRSVSFLRRLESRKLTELNQIQKIIFNITLRLIHEPNSELRSNSIDYTYHIENDKYLIIISQLAGHYSINLIEYKDDNINTINNFDVIFDSKYISVIIDNFDREVHKRMKNRKMLKNSKVAKHLQSILVEIEKK